VIIPCFNSGALVREAVASLDVDEPLEIIVVDDASTDPSTGAVLDQLEAEGVHVIRQAVNGGVAVTRTVGLRATSAPYVLPLDADDLAIPAQLTRAADLLDTDPDAAACVGDYEEFGTHAIVRTVPDRLDPYRVVYTNEYAITALMRRSVLEGYGGWTDPSPTARGYEDWDLWMDLAQDDLRIVHVGGTLYRRRMHAPGLDVKQRARHAELYRALRDTHPRLFARVREHRRRTDLSTPRTLLYPVLYGERRLINRVRFLKPLLDRAGVWTLARRQR
jgi:glycosyltransferase involved in cell wall biosynthesis